MRDDPFVDGNERTGTLATSSLSLNGLALAAEEAEVASIMQAVASGTLSESDLAAWLATHAITTKTP